MWVTSLPLSEQVQVYLYYLAATHLPLLPVFSLMDIFIKSAVAICDHATILSLFWDQEYLVPLT